MTFNITWSSYAYPNVTGFYDMILYANSTTSDIFGAAMLLAIYAVFFLVFQRYGEKEAFAASSFITMLLSMTLRGMGIVGDMIFILFITLTGIALLLTFSKK